MTSSPAQRARLLDLLDSLPPDKAETLLAFADYLRAQEAAAPEANGWDDWDRAIIAAEEYWFSLPPSSRDQYAGQIVAVAPGRILDSDPDRAALRARVSARFPDQPILYVEAGEHPLSPLIIRRPRLA